MWWWMLMAGIMGATSAGGMEFGTVQAKAQAVAAEPFMAKRHPLTEPLAQLTYDQYRQISFRPQLSLWRADRLPFEIQFIHPGVVYKNPVVIHEVDGNQVRDLAFSTSLFNYPNRDTRPPEGAGFAGFRVIQLSSPSHHTQEVSAFVGASYFRMDGYGELFGSSARGLALDTALPHAEEFPLFTEFWLNKPHRSDKTLTLFALMESPSVTGAFEFRIQPGVTTVTGVKAILYIRRPVERFGLAPLTSMFWHGETSQRPVSDFRPEVHDTDGLLIHNGRREWLWRPFGNAPQLRVNAFQDDSPLGFGLLQRDHDFGNYQDLEAKYHLRPSVWVEPRGQWGAGAIQLVQLPTDNEFNDNVVAFWVPEKTPQAGEQINLEYNIHWTAADPVPSDLGRVVATRMAEMSAFPPQCRFVLEFDSPPLQARPAGREPIPRVSCSTHAKLVNQSIQKNEFTGTWRLGFLVEMTNSSGPVELRAMLTADERPITETWTYTWLP